MEQVDIFSIVICTLGFLANLGVIIFVIKKKLYKRSFNICYLNLAVADLTFSISGYLDFLLSPNFLPPNLLENLPLYVFSNIMTRLINNYIQIVDFWAILPLTIDRLHAVARPISYKSVKLYKIYIAAAWILPFIYAITRSMVAYRGFTSPCDPQCFARRSRFFIFYTLIFGVIPLMFIVVTFTYILVTVNKSSFRTLQQKVTVFRAVATVLLFSASWVPLSIAVNILKVPWWRSLLPMLYLNTITDPLVYMTPNSVLVLILNMRIKKPVLPPSPDKRDTKH